MNSESNVSWLVASHLITSTSFITGTGLKKCNPPNLSTLFVALAISVIDNDDVLLANIVFLEL